MRLYRPVNQAELDLIKGLGWRAFPPRLNDQPIFYPVTNEEYATQITVDWNVPAYGTSYVVRFDVADDFMAAYAVQNVGAAHMNEYWIPSEDLAAMNDNIIGQIEVIGTYS